MKHRPKSRAATKEDLPIILEIMNEAISTSTAIYDYEPKDDVYIQHWFQERISANCPILVAEYDQQIAGYGTYFQFRPKEGFKFTAEHSVYIKKSFWSMGIGAGLLKELIRVAASNHIHSLVAGIDANNSISINMHEKLGFSKVGMIKDAAFKFEKWLDLVYYQLLLK